MVTFRKEDGGCGEADEADVAYPPNATERSASYLFAHCLGFGAIWGWIHAAFFSGSLWAGCSESFVSEIWLLNVLANGIAMVSFGLLACRWLRLGDCRGFAATMAALMAVGTISLYCWDMLQGLLAIVGAVFSGAGSAGILLLWAEAYESVAPGFAKKYTIPGSMLAGVCLFLFINVLPQAVALVFMMLLPAVSVSLLAWCKRAVPGIEAAFLVVDKPSSDGDASKGSADGALLAGGDPFVGWNSVASAVSPQFAVKVAVYCLPMGFLRGNVSSFHFVSATGIGGEVFAGVVAILVVVAAASILSLKERNIDLAYRFIVPFMAAGLLLIPFLDASRSSLVGVAIASGYIFLEMFVWASLADRASSADIPSAFVFGFGKVGMNIGLLAGTALGIWLASASSMLAISISVLLAYLFIVLESFGAKDGGAAFAVNASIEDGSKGGPVQVVTAAEAAQMNLSETYEAVLRERCRAISEKYGLSKRESEVLSYLARGQSLQAIAELLGVAYSTVKTHTDRIYSKTGVHSRSELISLMEQEE